MVPYWITVLLIVRSYEVVGAFLSRSTPTTAEVRSDMSLVRLTAQLAADFEHDIARVEYGRNHRLVLA